MQILHSCSVNTEPLHFSKHCTVAWFLSWMNHIFNELHGEWLHNLFSYLNIYNYLLKRWNIPTTNTLPACLEWHKQYSFLSFSDKNEPFDVASRENTKGLMTSCFSFRHTEEFLRDDSVQVPLFASIVDDASESLHYSYDFDGIVVHLADVSYITAGLHYLFVGKVDGSKVTLAPLAPDKEASGPSTLQCWRGQCSEKKCGDCPGLSGWGIFPKSDVSLPTLTAFTPCSRMRRSSRPMPLAWLMHFLTISNLDWEVCRHKIYSDRLCKRIVSPTWTGWTFCLTTRNSSSGSFTSLYCL